MAYETIGLLEFAKIFKNPTIQAIVGDGKTVYHIHPGALSSCGSQTFKARTSETWLKGASEDLDWTDFDEQTVECFLSWLYTGDYDVPGAADTSNGDCNQEIDDEDDGESLAASTKIESPIRNAVSPDESNEERPLTPLSRCIPVGLPADTIQTAAANFAQAVLQDCDEFLGDAALLHAKVYCFAHRFLVPRLEELALQRLTQILLKSDASNGVFVPRLAEAIHLVYESTPNAPHFNDPARKLLSQYVAMNSTKITTRSLRIIASSGGDFMADVSQKVTRHIRTSDSATKTLEEHIDKLEAEIEALRLERGTQKRALENAERQIQQWKSWDQDSVQGTTQGAPSPYGVFRSPI